jgi:hypothetical protein
MDVEEAVAAPWPVVALGMVLTVLLVIYLQKFFNRHYARPGAEAPAAFE